MGKVVRKEPFFDHETLSLAERLARTGYPPEQYVEIYKKERAGRAQTVTKWIVWEEEDMSAPSDVKRAG